VVPVPAGAENFSLDHRVQTGSGADPASYEMGTRGSFPGGVKWPGCETDHSPPSSAEVKKAWSYTTTTPIRLHGVVLSSKWHSDNFNTLVKLSIDYLTQEGRQLVEKAWSYLDSLLVYQPLLIIPARFVR
jgi:hypothetical protein